MLPSTQGAPFAHGINASHTSNNMDVWEGFVASWSMIMVSEIGDKTFFIACLMATRYPRMVVFLGAISALVTMTVLSAILGVLVPSLLSVKVTLLLMAVLFFVFGVKIIRSAFTDEDDCDDERAEAAATINKKSSATDVENGGVHDKGHWYHQCISPIFIQAFIFTFLAEWGDRSQIATIGLAAAHNAFGVTFGGIVGHTICTGGAVLFGNIIAASVSHRTINFCGGILFIIFSFATFYRLLYIDESHLDTSTAATSILMKSAKVTD
eukprot:Tbor_TRINITY_DN5899_c3_g2::TRINITY_DN5899_c3_g2_i1::g.6564::m.6564